MRKVLLTALALCTMGIASAQMNGNQARVYAYGLEQAVETGTVATYTLTFKTNTAATEASVNLKDANGDVKYTVPAVKTDDAGKAWEAVVDVYELNKLGKDVVAGDYTWEATVSAPSVDNFQMLNDYTKSDFTIYCSYAVAVDNSPESDYFGTVYATNQFKGTTTSSKAARETPVGIYAYTPDLHAMNNADPYSCDIVGIDETGTSAAGTARDMAIDSKGRIYISNCNSTYSGIYYVDPNFETGDFSANFLFQGGSRKGYSNGEIYLNGVYLGGRTSGIGVKGIGNNTELFALDFTQYSTNGTSYVNVYSLGEADVWTTAPSKIYSSFSRNDKKIVINNTHNSIDPVSTGCWIAQYRGATKETEPGLIYCDNNGIVQFTDMSDLNVASGSSRNGGLAVSERLGLVAYTITGGTAATTKARVISYNVNDDGSINAEIIGEYNLTQQGSRSNELAFDYAGNLYSVSSSVETFGVYALPIADNTCTTPAKASLKVKVTNEDILTGVEDIAVDANAPVEYYNLQGVKVENPSNGIFIKKQGTKATKVVL